MNYTEIHPDYVIDESLLKIGKFIPQVDIEIKELGSVASIDFPILFVISAWNFKNELISKIKSHRKLKRGGVDKFLNYFPSVELRQ